MNSYIHGEKLEPQRPPIYMGPNIHEAPTRARSLAKPQGTQNGQ